MSITVSLLRTWAPPVLDDAAFAFGTARARISDIARDLDTTIRMLDSGWEGDASDAATASIRTQAGVARELGEILSLVRRIILTLADTLTEAQRILAEADRIAAEHGLTVHGPSEIVYGDALTTEAREPQACAQVASLVSRALDMARWADADAARGLRAALDAGSLSVAEETALVDAVAAPGLPYDRSREAVAAWWATLTAAEQAALIRLNADVIGNLEGVPYDARVRANRISITRMLPELATDAVALRQQMSDVQAQIDALIDAGASRASGEMIMGLREECARLASELADNARMTDFCADLLRETTTGFDEHGNVIEISGHQVLIFDPVNGRFAEIVGTLGPRTENLAVMVGGTGSNLPGMGGDYGRSETFILDPQVTPAGSLTIINYLGGPMPQEVAFDAFDNGYARNLGPGLADFVNHLQNPSGAPVTVVGHSYGGSVVGAAEAAGMQADRILHVESAGAGPGVDSIDDYAYPGTDRYSMTAPGDPIVYAQGAGAGPVGHGADPNELGGMVRLETGYADVRDPAGGILQGGASHSGVFNRGTTAYDNILAVMTGDDVSLYRPPGWVPVEVNGQIVDDWQYPMENPSYRPPTMDVP